jgi:hydrogenase maturation protease
VSRSLVVGVGNVLLSDDGAGVHAARRLHPLLQQRTDVQVVDGGTLSFTLAPLIGAAERLIVIDAANLQAAPGTIRLFFGSDFDAFLGSAKLTVHEVSLVDLLDIARLTEALPAERVLVAVQPHTVEWGDVLTSDVETAMGRVMSTVIDLLDAWPEHPASIECPRMSLASLS